MSATMNSSKLFRRLPVRVSSSPAYMHKQVTEVDSFSKNHKAAILVYI